jgi:H(+)-translocating pyrophosphatase
MTSIAAGYIGMRIAVYTNTRVTFQCCSSVHNGFVTAFRGGQVLGFVLVGFGVLNIMIIIFIFKAGWYNEWLKKIAAAGKPHNNCPAGNNVDFVKAQTTLNGLFATYVDGQYAAFVNGFTKFHNTWCKDAPVFSSWDTTWKTYIDATANKDCKDYLYDRKAWNAASTDCKYVAADANDANKGMSCTAGGVINSAWFAIGTTTTPISSTYPWHTLGYAWSDQDQLDCMLWFNAAEYKWKQRVCVLTRRLFELVAGYGLGGSSVALFGRVGGGIYTKAADVGADLVGKVLKDLKEDDITNPGTIADNVGDNVGDIAGMGSDLFGSLAESSCASLVVSATSYELITHSNALFFPIAITASGAVASWFSVLLIHVKEVNMKNVQKILKFQVGASTVLMTGCIIPAIYILPESFTFEGGAEKIPITLGRWTAYGCVMFGLWSGMIIGFITEYYTNNAYAPTLYLYKACDKGAAPNIILGLALGYISVVVPIVCITATIGFAFATAGMYGIGLSALGMLGSLPVALSVDGFGPISDNAGGIAEMTGLPTEIRDLTDSLDAAGNTTAAVGKGFAIGSAALVGLALFGAFITRIGDTSVDILQPVQFAGLLIGAMDPYFFTALTMKAVGDAAYDMMDFIIADFRHGEELQREGRGAEYSPDYDGCIKISTEASLKKMIAPGALVIGVPICAGFIFGPHATAGVLAGNIVSGIQVAFSQSNSGGAWDNAKKEVEIRKTEFRISAEKEGVDLVKMRVAYNKLLAFQWSGNFDDKGLELENSNKEQFDKAKFDEYSVWMDKDIQLREQHIASIVGDTVGDPLKDTSGPAINILVKLSAITSLVFGNYLAHYHIFGNAPKPVTAASQLIKRCNGLGDNPNTTDYVQKQCEYWLGKDSGQSVAYFGWSGAVATYTGIPKVDQKLPINANDNVVS